MTSRRIFLKAGGAAAVAAGVAPTGLPAQTGPAAAPTEPPASGTERAAYRFFNSAEAAFIEAAVVRLIPPDEIGPSALDADVPRYIDLQLHGAWGAGERLYRSGPWVPGKPTQGYQLPFTPGELFRTAIRGIGQDLQAAGQPSFDKLSGQAQDAYLTRMQAQPRDLSGVASDVFFESLLSMTIEGYFCDPAYGGNRDMAAWAMIGFPGAHAAYYDLVDQYGIAFTQAPKSLAQAGRHLHLMPDIPATAPTPGRRSGQR